MRKNVNILWSVVELSTLYFMKLENKHLQRAL
jgi:hypothetical protein